MKAKEFDRAFDAGEDMSKYLDFSKATRPAKLDKDPFDYPKNIAHLHHVSADHEAGRNFTKHERIEG